MGTPEDQGDTSAAKGTDPGPSGVSADATKNSTPHKSPNGSGEDGQTPRIQNGAERGRFSVTVGPSEGDVLDDLRRTALRIHRLLTYAAETGEDIDTKASGFMLDFIRRVLNNETTTAEEEARFWREVSLLSRRLRPVTYATLSASKGASAKVAVGLFGGIALIFLTFLVVAQCYWVVLNNASETLLTALKDARESSAEIFYYTNYGDSVGPTLQASFADRKEEDTPRANEAGLVTERDRIRAILENCRIFRRSLYIALNTKVVLRNLLIFEEAIIGPELTEESAAEVSTLVVSKGFQFVLSACDQPTVNRNGEATPAPKAPEYIREADLIRAADLLRWTKQVLQTMSEYILPLLYGVVGASAFVLRSMSRSIRRLAYSNALVVQYLLRLVLGSLAGVSVGWVLRADSASTDALATISPLALAFVAGYSVELLFAAMDRFVDAFVPEDAGVGRSQKGRGDSHVSADRAV